MIYLASDHAGYELKEAIKKMLSEESIEHEDIGAASYDEKDDFPDFIIPCAEKVASNADNLGIIIGGSGQGEAIAANKVKGIRTAIYYGGPDEIVKLSKEHNNSNILSLGARFLTKEEAISAVKLWLNTEFSGDERHIRRIKKISEYES